MSASRSPRSRSLRRLGLALAATLVSLAAAEGVLRLAGFRFQLYPESSEFGWPDPEVMKNHFTSHDRFLWVRNGYAQKLARAREAHPHLVLMGCSCTAWGEFEVELARRVHAAGLPPVPMANLACSGWSTYQGLQQMKSDVVELAPKVVTIYYGWNDHWEGFGVDDETAARLTSSPLLLRLQRLRVVQLVTRALLSRQARAERAHGGDARPIRVPLPAFRANLAEMVAIARAHDIVPVLITAPTSHRVGEEPAKLAERWLKDLSRLVPLHQEYVAAVRQVAEEHDVLLLDLAADFAALPREELLTYMMDDGIHFTPLGGRKVGALIHEFLVENGLFPG